MDERFVAHDPSFADVTGWSPRLELVVECDAHEGPVYVADEDALYVTSLPAPGPRTVIQRIVLDGDRFPVARGCMEVLPTDAVMANGMTLDHDGRLVVCEQGDRTHDACISRDRSGDGGAHGRRRRLARPAAQLAQRRRRRRRRGDLVHRPDLRPPAGLPPAARGRRVRVPLGPGHAASPTSSPTASTSPTASPSAPTDRPCTSPTVAPTRPPAASTSTVPHHVVAFDVVGGRRLAGRRLLAVTVARHPRRAQGRRRRPGLRLVDDRRARVLARRRPARRDPRPRRRQLHVRRTGAQRPVRHQRHRDLGRRARHERPRPAGHRRHPSNLLTSGAPS